MSNALNPQQSCILDECGNVLVTACPGSGKTRVLTNRLLNGLKELSSTKKRVAAVTFTNRAADEIRSRLDGVDLPKHQLWAGTIHSFALEWILRPYSCYSNRLKNGFKVADEYLMNRLFDRLKRKYNVPLYEVVDTKLNRKGELSPSSRIGSKIPVAKELQIRDEYYTYLRERKLIDFDMVLYYSYRLISGNKEISKTLGAIMDLICIDEFQDTQDLQYGILSEIVKNSFGATKIFIVGDANQAIYSSLGGVAKSYDEIKEEFGISELCHLQLTGNYRSTQRIIDLSLNFQEDDTEIESLTDYAGEKGLITFDNQCCHKDDIPELITHLVRRHIDAGVSSHEICILAPQRWLITRLGRKLVALLPDVRFDAPGLSLLHNQRDNIWFKIARLFLVDPEPTRYVARLRWAGDVIKELEQLTGESVDDGEMTPKKLLRLVNAIDSVKKDGIKYLEEVFEQLTDKIGLNVDVYPALVDSWDSFFDTAEERLNDRRLHISGDVDSLKRMFRRPGGVVVTTCHGIKGEEYETVICFGALRGYIPHWRSIFNDLVDDEFEARKLIYVVISRAKKNLHMIAEYGRVTKSNLPYETSELLENVHFDYDVL